MQIKAIIDNIILERKENSQVVTTGEASEVLVANRLHQPKKTLIQRQPLTF